MNIRPALLKHITVTGLKGYLEKMGWSEEPFGRDTALKFISPQPIRDNHYLEVFIPSKRELIDYDRVVEIAVDCISAFEGEDFDSILSKILPYAVIERAEIRELISECERLIPKHRDDFALTQSLQSLRVREQNLIEEIRRL